MKLRMIESGHFSRSPIFSWMKVHRGAPIVKPNSQIPTNHPNIQANVTAVRRLTTFLDSSGSASANGSPLVVSPLFFKSTIS